MAQGRSIVVLVLLTFALIAAGRTGNTAHSQPTGDAGVTIETVLEGGVFAINCSVTMLPDIQVYWYKQAPNITFRQNGTLLEILDIRREASGLYICHAYEGDTGFDVEDIIIDVQYPATVSDMTLHPATAFAGHNVLIRATVEGNPVPDYRFINLRRDDVYYSSHGVGVQQIYFPVLCVDIGTWAVQASNSLTQGQWVTQTRNLTVLCPPMPNPQRPLVDKKKAFLGTNASFHVEYLGYPKVNVTWMHNDVVMPSGTQQNDDFSTTLFINNISVDDFGKYILRLSNLYGNHTHEFMLLAEGAPERPRDLQYYDLSYDNIASSYDSVMLRWASGFDMGSRQYFTVYNIIGNTSEALSGRIYDTSDTHGVGQYWKFNVMWLNPDTEYTLTVDARHNNDSYTEGFARPYVSFRTPKAPYRETKRVDEGQNPLVHCHETMYPDIQVYWYKQAPNITFRQNGTLLEFVDIRREASGLYKCHAVNTSRPGDTGWTAEMLTVDVQYPANVTSMQMVPAVVDEGEYVMVNGTIEGNPRPDYKVVNLRTGEVSFSGIAWGVMPSVVSPARCKDRAMWAIEVTNSLTPGVWVTLTRNLLVRCSPRPDPDRRITYEKKSFLRHNATFHMDYVGYPEATVTWYHNDRVLPSGMQKNVFNSTTLYINDVSLDDFGGEYTLEMENSIGSKSTDFKLNPDGPPQRPFDLEYYDITYDGVTLRWASGFDMGNQQYFTVYKITGKMFQSVSDRIYDKSSTHGIGRHWTYTVTGLDSNTEYNLTVEAMNDDQNYTEGFAVPYARFTTLRRPPPTDDDDDNVYGTIEIVGGSVGALVFVGLLAFVVYLVKYRRMRTSYTNVDGKK